MQEQPVLLEEDGFEDEILVEEETTVVNAMWGDIGGNIENQTDLQNALDAKQDSLTEAQLNAVNSGITAEKVTTYDGYADQIASKADQSALSAEATTREQADTALGRRIDDEATARQNADNGLQSQIDAITSQSDVVDVVANYAALQAYDTSSLSDNDVIKVLDDETHEDALTYYRWSTTTQTWSYIGQEAPYYSKGQMDVMLQGKQDTLTAGANIQIQNGTISATDTTYTAGNGLNLNSTEFSADTTVLATKEDLEGYYTKTETDNLLAPKLEAEVVAELPTTGEEGKLYLTQKAHMTQTATGNPITATVAEDAGALESFQLDGDTFQKSHTGKNLLDVGEFVATGSYAGLTVEIVNKDESTGSFGLKLTGNVSENLWSIFERTKDVQLKPNTTYTLSRTFSVDGEQLTGSGGIRIKNGSSYTATTYDASATFTTGATGLVQILVYASYNQSGPSTNIDTTINFSNLQLEESSTATSFEPFVGGQPSPSPEYPQPIQTVTGEQTVTIVGKNLFDKDSAINGKVLSADGTLESSSSEYYTSDFIPVEPNTAYYKTFSLSVRFKYYGADKVALSTSGYQDIANAANAQSFTTPSGAYYVRLSLGVAYLDTLQIEKGTATAYAPYQATSYPLDLGSIELCKLGTYQDYIWNDGGTWKIRKETAKFSFAGYTRSTGLSKRSGDVAGFVINAANNPLRGHKNPLIGYCSHFIVEETQTTWTAIGKTGLGSGDALWFGTAATSDSRTLTQFLDWLSAEAVTYYYAINTPTDTVITDQTLITQLEAIRTALLQNGANTITNTATGSNLAGDMEIGYYGFTPRNRYDKWLWLDINNEYEQIGS